MSSSQHHSMWEYMSVACLCSETLFLVVYKGRNCAGRWQHMNCICKHCRWLPEQDTAKCEIRNWSAGEQRRRAPWTIKATKKMHICWYKEEFPAFIPFLLWFLSCKSLLLPLYLTGELTTCCSISFDSHCWPFQQVQYHDPRFTEKSCFPYFSSIHC